MKLHQFITVTATFAVVTSFAHANELPKGARADIKAVVKEQNGPDVPPELRTPRVDARTEKMRLLIIQGIKDGTLTVGEATSLEHELARIEREEKTYKQNGRAGRRERRDLNRDLNELHERIWKKTHNGAQPPQPLEK